MFNIKKAQVVILGCRCFFMTFHNIKGEKFDVDGNYIKYFEMANSNFDRVAFDHRQLDIKNIRKRLYKNPMNLEFKKYTNLIMDLNLFEFIPYKTSKEIKSNEVYNTMVSTLSFLKNSTTLATDRDKFTEILYYEVLIAQKKASHRVFVWFIGGFLKPFRFITLAICVLLIFAVVYSLPIFQFSISSIGNTGSLSFFDALYFSGITFTSIGYGDISPLGFTRLLAVVEGISGIAIMSSFLVALVNKYLD
jgi:hypothetical protein